MLKTWRITSVREIFAYSGTTFLKHLFFKKRSFKTSIDVRPHLQSAGIHPLHPLPTATSKAHLALLAKRGTWYAAYLSAFTLIWLPLRNFSTLFYIFFAPISIYTTSLYRIKLSIFNPHNSPSLLLWSDEAAQLRILHLSAFPLHEAVSIRISSRLRARWLIFLSAFFSPHCTVISTFFAAFSLMTPPDCSFIIQPVQHSLYHAAFLFTATTFLPRAALQFPSFPCNSEIGGNNFTTCRTSSRCSSSLFPYTRSMLSSGSTRSSSSSVASFSRPTLQPFEHPFAILPYNAFCSFYNSLSFHTLCRD